MMPLFVVAVAKISASFAVSSACSEGRGERSKAVKRIVKAEFMRDIDRPLR
jgi:L-asparaginase II